jgi:hypothetical protein
MKKRKIHYLLTLIDKTLLPCINISRYSYLYVNAELLM